MTSRSSWIVIPVAPRPSLPGRGRTPRSSSTTSTRASRSTPTCDRRLSWATWA
ncbi:unnamed protein product, partial [Symbiodinium necroappetens]